MVKAIAVTVMPNVMPMPMKPSGAAPPNPSATIAAQPISTSTAVPNASAKYFNVLPLIVSSPLPRAPYRRTVGRYQIK
jgi:hypothetical protein